MVGALEEGAKAAGGVIEALRAQPLALANIVLNIAFLVFLFYYVSIIARRAESTVAALFANNDKLYVQWATVIKDQNDLTARTMHCIPVEDALKLLEANPNAPKPPIIAPDKQGLTAPKPEEPPGVYPPSNLEGLQ